MLPPYTPEAFSPSMGPRPNGRGKFSSGLVAPALSTVLPSMGPRPNGRGKGGLRTRRSCRCYTFNGAAAKRPRKDVCRRLDDGAKRLQWGRGQTAAERIGQRCNKHTGETFNGAAAKRPRKVGLGPAARLLHCAAFNGAAAKRPRKEAPDHMGDLAFHPSMGPRPNGRGKSGVGNSFDCKTLPSMGPRPNGRGKAEMSVAAPTSMASFNGAAAKRPRKVAALLWFRPRSYRAFNGAAAKRPRKVAAANPEAAAANRLQWGRGQTAAESYLVATTCRTFLSFNGAAAKRPRKAPGAARRPTCRSLQWGRGQTAAERRSARNRTSYSSTFNGAAAKRPRKGRPPNPRRPAAIPFNGAAAKRPRKAHHNLFARSHTPTFNGAAAKRPRKARQAGRPKSGYESFNGAAAKRPRKVFAHLGRHGQKCPSMGPRPNGRGK